ncbi:Dolichyl-diphosphooligosaccharide--protein glycosyltransferase subunit stt3b [Cichlidogyrus casuarinus]|uniref:dolichyl-diphosphooligosaccharide--protein glycotransferase n=1 Tax=Cichlidogyrus casuarinus TaxID=1844966 RepID=A0ABD2QBZ9_9PLAT
MSSKGIFSRADTGLLSSSGCKGLLTFFILAVAWLVGFGSRLFSVIRFESIIHEFDPWFNYRATKFMVENDFYTFLNWFDERAWYPLGRIVGGTVYPGLMITSGAIHSFLHFINFPIHIREICVFLAPFFSGLTAIATYLLTKEAIKTGKVFWSVCCALSYFYMVSAWGGYVFIINLIPLHVFVLLLMQRFSQRVYVAYTSFYVLALISAMQVPFVGFQPIRTSEHMAAAGVFVLLQGVALYFYLKNRVSASKLKGLLSLLVLSFAGLVFLAVVGLTYAGIIAPWSGRFYSLWDTGYAKIHIPIISSVSEHQPTSWTSYFFDLHVLVCVFPAGVWFCFKNLTDERVFIVLYAIFASYFSGVMVRLILTLTPIVCVFAAIAFSRFFEVCLVEDTSKLSDSDSSETDRSKPKRASRQNNANSTTGDEIFGFSIKHILMMVGIYVLLLFVMHCTWVTSNAYSSPSVVLASYRQDGSKVIIDDFREAYFWLQMNTPTDAHVMSWWDYGYQIAGMGNKTTLVDNNTWNNSHIALVGKAMASNETESYKLMQSLDVDYVLVIFGGLLGYSGDDINKFLWMVTKTMADSLMYKLSYYRFADLKVDPRGPTGFDRARNVEIGMKNIKLTHLEEALTTENWIVRIYRVKKPQSRQKLRQTKQRINISYLQRLGSAGRKGVMNDQVGDVSIAA